MKLVRIILFGLLVSANKKYEPTKKDEVLDLIKQATKNISFNVSAPVNSIAADSS